MFRILSVACAVAACGLLGWAGYTALHPPADLPVATDGAGPSEEPAGLVVDGAEQDVGERPVGEHPVTFRVTNRSGRPGEVVGYPGACGRGCCLFVRDADRRAVPPGETIEVVGELDVRRPGPFEFEGELYLDDGGQLRTVRVRITGVGVGPKGKPDAPPR